MPTWLNLSTELEHTSTCSRHISSHCIPGTWDVEQDWPPKDCPALFGDQPSFNANLTFRIVIKFRSCSSSSSKKTLSAQVIFEMNVS